MTSVPQLSLFLIPMLGIFLAIAILAVVAIVLGTAARPRRNGEMENNPLSVGQGIVPPAQESPHHTSALLLYEMQQAAETPATTSSPAATTHHLSPTDTLSHHAPTTMHHDAATTMPADNSFGSHHGH